MPCYFTQKEAIGQGAVHQTGELVQLNKVRIVLKMQGYRGKLYYILTAFPDLELCRSHASDRMRPTEPYRLTSKDYRRSFSLG